MSVDTNAVKRVITSLQGLIRKAEKAAKQDKAEREERLQVLLGDYTTVEEIHDAYGYAEVTCEERDALLAIVDDKTTPDRSELSENELYVLELRNLLKTAQRRLHDVEWSELPEPEQDRINADKAERMARIQNRKKEAAYVR